MIINNVLTMNAPDSANVSAHHIPSIPPKRAGKNSTAATWKTHVLKNEIAAETAPFDRAVKKDEAKILNPASTNENANI